MFVVAAQKGEAQGTVLTVGNLQPAVARVFTTAGVDQVLRIIE